MRLRHIVLGGIVCSLLIGLAVYAAGSHTLFDNALAPSGVALKNVQPGLDGKAPFINVRAAPYFAVGDGVADDGPPVAAACTSAGASGEVLLPAGTYRISTNTVCAAQIKLAKGASFSVDSGIILTSTGTIINDNGRENFNESAVSFPPDFPATGITFTRDAAGTYSSSFDPDAYVATWGITKTYYVNNNGGSDANPGTIGSPFVTVNKAIDTAIAGADTAVQINVVTGGADILLTRDQFTLNSATKTISGKRIYVTPDNTAKKVYASNAQTGLSWSLNTGSTYQATRSSVSTVVDMNNKDPNGIPRAYTLQASIAAVDANPGSWFASGGIVYVRTLTGAIPTFPTQLVFVDLSQVKYDVGAAGEVFFRNIYFLSSAGVPVFLENVASDYTATKFVAYNCAFTWGDPPALVNGGSNGLAIESIKSVQIYNSFAAYNSADGFNFHYTRADPATRAVRGYYALVVNSSAYDNGLGNLSGTGTDINNAFTAHEGVNFACVGCLGWNTQGPVFAFVNGVNAVLIGSKSRLSARTVVNNQHAAYYFDQTFLPTGITGKVYMDDCEGNDTNLDLSTDGTNLPITLRDFTGTKIYSGALPYVRWLPSNTLASREQAKQYTGAILGTTSGTIPTPTQTLVGKGAGSGTLTSASPSTATATVLSGAKCIATNNTTAANGLKTVVSGTTLTITGPNTVTDAFTYLCF